MNKDIKKALEHCIECNCDNCPNREELGSGEIVCRGRLLSEILEYVVDLETKLAESENKVKGFVELFDKKQHENYEQFCEIQELKHQLSITEKALELACDKIADMLAQNGGGAWFYDFDGDTVIERNGFENFYKRYAKEMLKDE